jgi:hypothetical protein
VPVLRYRRYEHLGGEKMSILSHIPKLVVKSKYVEPTTSSILLISIAIFLAIILVTHMGVVFTDNTMKKDSTCRGKIVGFEQRGMYTSPEQFKLALSYCGTM